MNRGGEDNFVRSSWFWINFHCLIFALIFSWILRNFFSIKAIEVLKSWQNELKAKQMTCMTMLHSKIWGRKLCYRLIGNFFTENPKKFKRVPLFNIFYVVSYNQKTASNFYFRKTVFLMENQTKFIDSRWIYFLFCSVCHNAFLSISSSCVKDFFCVFLIFCCNLWRTQGNTKNSTII